MPLKAIALVSGGLDGALAAKIIKLQGVEVMGIVFILFGIYRIVLYRTQAKRYELKRGNKDDDEN